MPFTFKELDIPGAMIIEPRVFNDGRGFFLESYKHSDFAAHGLAEHFVQENHSVSAKNILRGFHYQRPPHGQAKLVRVIVGEILDVGIDLRKDSSTYGKWISVNLSAENRRMLYLPPWCAHGFLVLSETAQVVYKVTAEYNKEAEGGIIWNDPHIGIDWPCSDPTLSDRDKLWPRLSELPDTEMLPRQAASPDAMEMKCSLTA